MSSRLTLFFCEFITAGGLCDEPLPISLMHEGRMMRDAVLNDLLVLDTHDILTMHDGRVGPTLISQNSKGLSSHLVTPGTFKQTFESLVNRADMVWMIAPESDAILADLVAFVAQQNVKLIGNGLETTQIATNKLRTIAYLTKHGMPTVNTMSGQDWLSKPNKRAIMMQQPAAKQTEIGTNAWLVKPIDGVGCDGIQLFASSSDVDLWLQEENRSKKFLVQPFHTGISGSIAMLCRNGKAWLLSCNRQVVALKNNTLSLKAITINGMANEWSRLAVLANEIAAALPDAVGYLGVDLMLDPVHDKIEVLEINPRLTTSYVALSQATGVNIADLILACHLSPTFTMPPIQRNLITLKVN